MEVSAVTMKTVEKYLWIDLKTKLLFYFTAIFIVSLFVDYMFWELDPTYWYLARKNNLLNLLFAKWAWLWTLLTVGSFVTLSSYVYCCADELEVAVQLSRLVVGSVVWYATTSLFVKVAKSTRSCLLPNNNLGRTRDLFGQSCAELGGVQGGGFDISGHCFLLIYSSAIIAEESRVFQRWNRLKNVLSRALAVEDADERPVEFARMNRRELLAVNDAYIRFTPWIKLSFLSMGILQLIWDVTLVFTVLFYHTWPQKVFGACFAIVAWLFTYRALFRWNSWPDMPGKRSKIRLFSA